MKKILVYGQFPPPLHGCNVMTKIFVETLAGLGYDARLSKKEYSKTVQEVGHFKPVKIGRSLIVFFRFIKNLIFFKPDMCVFVFATSRWGILSDGIFARMARFFRIPYVLYLHTLLGMDLEAGKGRVERMALKIFRSATACLVLGEAQRREVEPYLARPAFILPNCLRDEELPQRRREKKSVSVLFLSNITLQKGILTLIKALSIIAMKQKDVKVVVAGPWKDAALKDQIDRIIEENTLNSSVLIFGPADERQKAELFLSNDIFVLPSYHEAFPLVVLEAMRAGLPVVASRIGGVPEAVLDGETGFLVPAGDPVLLAEKILLLAVNSELRESMGLRARQRFQAKFSMESYRMELKKIFSEIAWEM